LAEAHDSENAAAVSTDLKPIEDAATRLSLDGLLVAVASASLEDFALLDAAQQALLKTGTAARRQEFASGRIAAARALLLAGCSETLVLADDDGVPTFPVGYAGSIAHKEGRAISIVLATSNNVSVGIDLEFDSALHDDDLLQGEAVEAERQQFPALQAVDPSLRSIPTLVIAAKEALYKAVFPLLRHRFDFDEAEVAFDPPSGRFVGRRFPGSNLVTVRGAHAHSGGWIVAAAIAKR
jgi:4'-phosphopantetheinyl transferase EntD